MKNRKLPVYGARPQAHLLPAELHAERIHERALPKMLAALIVAGVAVAGLWGIGTAVVAFEQQKLVTAQDEQIAKTAEIAEFSEIQELMQAVGTREADRIQGTATEVMYAPLRDELVALLPENTRLEKITAHNRSSVAETPETFHELGCDATGTVVIVTLESNPATAQANAAEFLNRVSQTVHYSCGELLSISTDTGEETQATKTELKLGFADTIRENRFAPSESTEEVTE